MCAAMPSSASPVPEACRLSAVAKASRQIGGTVPGRPACQSSYAPV